MFNEDKSSPSILKGLVSKRAAVYLGLNVLPNILSPWGDLGGVYPLGEYDVWIFDENIGEGWDNAVFPGFITSPIKVPINF